MSPFAKSGGPAIRGEGQARLWINEIMLMELKWALRSHPRKGKQKEKELQMSVGRAHLP
jgi:hypothetical protein